MIAIESNPFDGLGTIDVQSTRKIKAGLAGGIVTSAGLPCPADV
jgi:hypothetical protein